MKILRRTMCVSAICIISLSTTILGWGQDSFTRAARIDDQEPLWLVEISENSLQKMKEMLDRTSRVHAFLDEIKWGFDELERDRENFPTLGFHWHKTSVLSGCNLYGVEYNEEARRRQLVESKSYGTFENYETSCKDIGTHLRKLINGVTTTSILRSNDVWGVMVPSIEPGAMSNSSSTVGKLNLLGINKLIGAENPCHYIPVRDAILHDSAYEPGSVFPSSILI